MTTKAYIHVSPKVRTGLQIYTMAVMPYYIKALEAQVRQRAHWQSVSNPKNQHHQSHTLYCRAVFLNRRAAARYRALASIIQGRERFSWNLSF